MQNNRSSGANPGVPVDAEAARRTREGLVDGEVEENVEKTEAEKEADSRPEDREPFNLDKVDELEKSKKESEKD